LAEMAELMTVYPQVMVNVRGVDHQRIHDDEEIAAEVAAWETKLGETGRIVLRPSGTEPMVRVMVEAAEQETAESIAAELAELVRTRLPLYPRPTSVARVFSCSAPLWVECLREAKMYRGL